MSSFLKRLSRSFVRNTHKNPHKARVRRRTRYDRFLESEFEGRKVFYHSITAEDTGEDVLTMTTRITIAHLDLLCRQAQASTLWLTWTTFTVKFHRCRAVRIEQLDNYDQGSEGTSLNSVKPQFRSNAATYVTVPSPLHLIKNRLNLMTTRECFPF